MIAPIFDALDLWWSADFVNYDLRGQSRLVEAGRTWLRDLQQRARSYVALPFGRSGTRPSDEHASPWLLSPAVWPAFLAALALLALVLMRARITGFAHRLGRTLARLHAGSDPGGVMVGFYAEALEILRGRGCVRSRCQTPLEFAHGLAGEPFGEALISITDLYNRIRFGAVVHEGDFAQAHDLLKILRREDLKPQGAAHFTTTKTRRGAAGKPGA
jgi:hypothetical protein